MQSDHFVSLSAALLRMTSNAFAQSFNIDFGAAGTPNPAATYGAAAAQPGTWNAITPGGTSPLADLSGAATGVTLNAPPGSYEFDNLATFGDDEKLLDDIVDNYTAGYVTVAGLADGSYTIYTYALAPDDDSFLTYVSVSGSPDPQQTVGGYFLNGHALGTTYAMHQVDVVGGASVYIYLPDGGTWYPISCNGLQIVRHETLGTSLCYGDGTTDSGSEPVNCPCGNTTPVGDLQGCKHSLGHGARLSAFGSTSFVADDLSFMVDLAIPGQSAVLIQGSNFIATAFTDGILCTGSPTERVEFFTVDGQGVGFTTGSIVTNGNVPGPGSMRYYQGWFRNPGGVSPCGSGSNLTHALKIDYE